MNKVIQNYLTLRPLLPIGQDFPTAVVLHNPMALAGARMLRDSANISNADLENPMGKHLVGAAVLAGAACIAWEASASIPLVNATCPGKIEVHADEGGPIYINGKEGKLKKFSNSYYEAKGSGVTISLSINPDGSAAVSYTGKGGANGICTVKEN